MNKKNADRPAFGGAYDTVLFDPSGKEPAHKIEARMKGMTKRELIAALALQGYLAGRNNSGCDSTKGYVAASCVGYADALLAELERIA